MKTFLKLRSGAIIYVTQINELFNVICGFNLDSPNLRGKTFPIKQVDWLWEPSYREIKDRADTTPRSTEDCLYHPQTVTAKRQELIDKLLHGVLQWEITKKTMLSKAWQDY